MRILASAPGKLVIAGEYAVLEGAPALVMAVDRRARVVLRAGVGDEFRLDAPDLGISGARFQLMPGETLRWIGVDRGDVERLAFVAGVIEVMAADHRPAPFSLELDTGAFFSMGAGRTKLGLGSSAALTVALGGAIHAWTGRPPPPAVTLIAAHRRAQGGRGSGLDVAASLTGGLILYRMGVDEPRIDPVVWPTGLAFCSVWSGRSASTGDFLRRLAEWRASAPSRYRASLRALVASSEAAARAVEVDDAVALLGALADFADQLARLGRDSGIDIVSAEHRAITAVAARCGVTYKSCGAGGGDLGIALTAEAERIDAFRQAVTAAGFRVLDLNLDRGGLRVHRESEMQVEDGHPD